MFGEYAGVRLMSKPPYPYRIAGRGPSAAHPTGADDEHPHRGPVLGPVRHLPRRHVGDLDAARRGGPGGHRGIPRVEPQHHRGRRVVGVDEPRLVPALGPLAGSARGAQAGQRHLARPLAGGQVVHGDLAERVPGPAGQQDRAVQLGPVQDGVSAQHRLGILADQVAPGGRDRAPRVGGVRHRDPAARRAVVGEHVEPPVPADPDAGLGVDPLLDHPEVGRGGIGFGQVGDPQVVARRGAPRRRDDQPPPVPADRDAVVVGLVPALAEDEHVLVRRARRPGAGRPAGGTGSPRPVPPPAAACGCSRRPCRRAARPRSSTGTGRSARRPASPWSRRSPAAATPRRRPRTAGRPAAAPPCPAARRPAWSARTGRWPSGRRAPAPGLSPSLVHSTPCSPPGSRLV